MTLDTPRLALVPNEPAHLLALIESRERYEERTGLRVADGLRDFMVSDDVSPQWLAMLRNSTAADPWLHGFSVVERESRTVIGTAAFKGPPDDSGMVEIAYGIAPGLQGRGYATEAAMALVSFASRDSTVQLIRAHTLPEPNASTRVLAKCGFERVGEVVDPEDGLVWRWERAPT
jgi:[ribosomal protein S5]-alanine N-acetyltransferase